MVPLLARSIAAASSNGVRHTMSGRSVPEAMRV